MLCRQTQYRVANQLARPVIGDVAAALHLHQLDTHRHWLAAQIICQVCCVPVGKNMWMLEQQQVLIHPVFKQSRLQCEGFAIWHTTKPPDMKCCR
jgi:hypothetical protein